MGRRQIPALRSVGVQAAVDRLSRLAPMPPEAADLVASLGDWRASPPGTDIGHAGERRLWIQGWGAKIAAGARGRQIINFILPGDISGLSLPCEQPRCATIALTACQTLDASPLVAARVATAGGPIARILREVRKAEDHYVVSQVVRLGRMSAYERTAHLILELYVRLGRAEAEDPSSMEFPLTQETLADATGMSVVHVNRVLQQMRQELLLEIRPGWLHEINHSALERAARLAEPG